MLDQNTDRMWYVIGAVIVGAALIFLVNSSFPQLFASVGDTFTKKSNEIAGEVSLIGKDSEYVNENMILEYDFKNHSGDPLIIADSTGKSGNGALMNFELKPENGWKEDGLQIGGGTTFVRGPSDMKFEKEAITVESRVRFDNLSYDKSDGSLLTIVRKGNLDKLDPHSGFSLVYDNRSRRGTFHYTNVGNTEGGYAGGKNSFPHASGRFSETQWLTLSYTVDEKGMGVLYIDGQEVSKKQFVNVSLNTPDSMNIGWWGTTGNETKDFMTLQSVRIYDRALSQTEIIQNHHHDVVR